MLYAPDGRREPFLRCPTVPGQASLHSAARQLGIRHAILASQIRQLETVTGTALLRTGPNGMIVLTPDGGQFARDIRPALEALTQSRQKNPSHAP